MKNVIKSLAVLLLLFFLNSCAYQDESAVFYLDDTVTKTITVNADDFKNSNGNIEVLSKLNLMQSETFAKHIEHLRDLRIVYFEIKMKSSNNLPRANGRLNFDDVEVNCFDPKTMDQHHVKNVELLKIIESKLYEDNELLLSYSCNKNEMQASYTIEIEMGVAGTFAN